MRKYHTRVNEVISKFQPIDFKAYKAYCCISFSNPNFYGKKLEAVIRFLSDHFSQSLIITSGYLYRHHYALHNMGNEELALTQAKEKEEHYISQELTPTLKNINDSSIRTIDWFSLKEKKEYLSSLNTIYNLYKENEFFRQEISETSKLFVLKQESLGNLTVPKESGIAFSEKFLLEEIAMFDFLVGQDYQLEVYPGNHVPVLKKIIGGFLPEAPGNLKKRINISLHLQRVGRKSVFEARNAEKTIA